MPSLPALLLLAAASAGPLPAEASRTPPPPQQAFPFTLDFETGDLRGWTATGNAFVFQPTLDDNPTARERGQPSNHQGRYWIGTFERFQGQIRQRPGGTQGDEPQGTLTSAQFVIPSGTLSFLVGGGASFETRVELLVYDQIENVWTRALHASGTNEESMHRVRWDLSRLVDRLGKLQIVDASSAGWGHINVDDFAFSGPAPPPNGLAVFDPPIVAVTPPQTRVVPVPRLIDQTPEGAEAILFDLPLRLGEVGSQPSPRPVGTIIEQFPPADSLVPAGSAVNVVVAAGVPVPNLIGRGRAEVDVALRAARLTVGQMASQPSPRPTGTVIVQDPPPGVEVPLSSPVNVVIAAGVGVPDLQKRRIGEAQTMLSGTGLKLGRVGREPSASQPGTVLRQSPGPGVVVPLGTEVDVDVAAPVPVPNLIGEERERIGSILATAGLESGAVTTRPSERQPGTVIDQKPGASSPVPLGTRVDVVVAEAVPVPEVIGFDSAGAAGRIAAARMRVGSVRGELSERPTGTVIDQDPPAGTMAPLLTPLDLVLAAPAPVPDLVGRGIGAARQAIETSRLAVGVLTARTSARAPGTVLEQTPEAGAQVPLRTPIDLIVAAGVPVPGLVGRDSAAAMTLLDEAGLRPGTMESRPSPEPAGSVVEQTPAAGDQVALQSPVDLVIAAAVPVPDLLEFDRAGAQEQLGGIGLAYVEAGTRLSFKPGGTVLAQQPDPGSLVPLGTPVRLTLARHVPMEGVGAGLLTLLAASGLFVRTRLRRPRPEPEPETGGEPRRANVIPHPDPGTQTFEAGGPPGRSLELRLRAVLDAGEQTIAAAGPLMEDDQDG